MEPPRKKPKSGKSSSGKFNRGGFVLRCLDVSGCCIRLTLEHGRIVGIHADTNEEVLRQAIETDEGAHYLGEIALVPVDSPIAQSGLLFYNTLFDENAACHFAFGQAYPACVPGGDDLPEEELVRRGINVVSTMHVDFMVGTEDLSIIGTTKDGREVTVFENGRFAL